MSSDIENSDFIYTVSIRTRDGEQALDIIAWSTNPDTAAAAFEQALKIHPHQRIALRQGKKTLRERLVPGQDELGTDFS